MKQNLAAIGMTIVDDRSHGDPLVFSYKISNFRKYKKNKVNFETVMTSYNIYLSWTRLDKKDELMLEENFAMLPVQLIW